MRFVRIRQDDRECNTAQQRGDGLDPFGNKRAHTMQPSMTKYYIVYHSSSFFLVPFSLFFPCFFLFFFLKNCFGFLEADMGRLSHIEMVDRCDLDIRQVDFGQG